MHPTPARVTLRAYVAPLGARIAPRAGVGDRGRSTNI